MQKLDRPIMTLNVNPKMVSTVHRIRVTWTTGDTWYWFTCSLHTQSLSESIFLKVKTTLHCIKLLIAAVKNIYMYVFMGTFSLKYLYDLFIVPVLSDLSLLQTKINELLCLYVSVVVSSVSLIEVRSFYNVFLLLTWILRDWRGSTVWWWMETKILWWACHIQRYTWNIIL